MRLRAADGTVYVVCYHEGLDTGQGMDKFTRCAFGHGIEANISTLYRFSRCP